MSPGISFPQNLTFKEFLSHTFPGFFLALSVFMLLDVLSPKDLTSWAFGSLTDFLSAMTFIILLGTILGILIDGIQHLIEERFFKVGKYYKDTVEDREKKINIYPIDAVRHYYYFKQVGQESFIYLTDNYYRYAEFYGNIFISLIAFSLIAPSYFCYRLRIPLSESIILGCAVPVVFAVICIYSSYKTFVVYHSHRIDMILGSFGSINSIEVTADPSCISQSSPSKRSTITAKLKRWKLVGSDENVVWKVSDVQQSGVNINFEIYNTDIGKRKLDQKETIKGIATTNVVPNKNLSHGTATVRASSKGFIPGEALITIVQLNDKKKE